jgi:Homeodomain-like domain
MYAIVLSAGKHAERKLKRAQILLAADAGVSDDDIATSVGVELRTAFRRYHHNAGRAGMLGDWGADS